MMKFLLILILFCKPADPNFRLKPLQNLEYTGFIARNFFQVVVEVPITKEELSILEEREVCKKEAIFKRDKIVIPILKKIAIESDKNEPLLEREKDWKENKKEINSDSYKIISFEKETNKTKPAILNAKGKTFFNKGEFTWFLDTMKIHKEIYDDKKCILVFRKIEKNLFAKVENTKLGAIGEETKLTEQNQTETQNGQVPNQNSNQSPLGTGIPTVR